MLLILSNTPKSKHNCLYLNPCLDIHAKKFYVNIHAIKHDNYSIIFAVEKEGKQDQSMTQAVFLTLGRRRSSHSKKLGLQPKA